MKLNVTYTSYLLIIDEWDIPEDDTSFLDVKLGDDFAQDDFDFPEDGLELDEENTPAKEEATVGAVSFQSLHIASKLHY